MNITMRSTFTGVLNTMDIPITAEEFNRWQNSGELIQRVFPDLSPEHREFLMTGATPEEWLTLMGPEEDGDEYQGDVPAF